MQETIGRFILARRHSALLLTIVALFAVRPLLGDTGPGAVAFSLAILLVVLTAMVTIEVDDLVGDPQVLLTQRKRRLVIGWSLAALAVAERLWVFVAPSRTQFLIGVGSWLLFFCYVALGQLRSLVRQRHVTGETISLAISIYLLIGVCWALLYILIHMLDPGSFNLPVASWPGEQHLFPVFVYFSLTTLTTVGFGDITPLTLPSRYAAVAEAIAGQFYLAILVARLVGMQMSQSVGAASREPAHESPRSLDG